jgi:hypothetical protein
MTACIGSNLVGKTRSGRENAIVDEEEAAMPAVSLDPAQRIDENLILRIKNAGGEYDGKFVGNGELLKPVDCGTSWSGAIGHPCLIWSWIRHTSTHREVSKPKHSTPAP